MDADSAEPEVLNGLIENDDAFDALAHGQRRHLLVDLLNSDPQLVSILSGASRELLDANETLLDHFLSSHLEIAGVDKDLVRTHHVHLPKLAAYGFVEWYPEERIVTKGSRFDEVEPLLKLLDDRGEERAATGRVVPFR